MAIMNAEIQQRFHDIVSSILIGLGFEVRRERSDGNDRADLIATQNGTRMLVEIKAYRSPNVAFTTLRNAASRLFYLRSKSRGASATLVTNAVVNPDVQQRLSVEFGISIFGQAELIGLASPQDKSILEDLLREMFTFDVNPKTHPSDSNVGEGFTEEQHGDDPTSFKLENIWAAEDSNDRLPSGLGAQLCSMLHGIQPGRQESSVFENVCEEALAYLFRDHLVGWTRQSATNTGLHIFDLIARISSSNSFWLTLSQQFRTRNPVFEFKNYSDPITQAQIYTTEKYLYPSALRGTALIIAREGCTENANEARRGALREAGKLILVLSLEDVCTMLHAKDLGDEPSDFLADKLDEMLFHLDR